jgi:AmmeMemoRadiSam system protein B
MSPHSQVRRPAVAGQFYEGRPEALRKRVEDCFLHKLGPGSLPQVAEDGPRRILGLVSPHAGLMYSGPPAAHGFWHLAADGVPDTIVLFGPNHHWGASRSDADVMAEGAWATPLGETQIDAELARAFLNESHVLGESARTHEAEHSLEVQLPFLQYCFGDRIKIVPVAINHQILPVAEALGSALARVTPKDRRIVVIASTDFTHHRPQQVAERDDRAVIEEILRLSPEGVFDVVRDRNVTMCGYGPVAAMLAWAKRVGATRAELLQYSTSGDIIRDYSAVVGYASVKVTR